MKGEKKTRFTYKKNNNNKTEKISIKLISGSLKKEN